MTATLSLAFRRRSPLGREELRRQVLALILAFVLTWYTLVAPAGAFARSPGRFEPGDEGHDGEVRGANRVRGAGGATTPAKEDARAGGEDLDWPEYIYP